MPPNESKPPEAMQALLQSMYAPATPLEGIADPPESMTALLATYYTPDLTTEPFQELPATFVEAVEAENVELAEELTKADRFQKTQQAIQSGVDCEYFTSLVFTSAAQCQAFLKHMGWEKYTDGTLSYINGVALAQDLGIPLPPGYLAGVPKHERKTTHGT